jgi:protein-disulfide isomerase
VDSEEVADAGEAYRTMVGIMIRRMLPAVAAGMLVLAGYAQTTKKSALDKSTLEAYVRHMYVMDSSIAVQVSDPKPSQDMPGFLDVTVHASKGTAAQDFKFYVSKDGSRLVQGTVFEIAHNPFKADLDKLKMEGAPGIGTSGAPVVIVEFSDFECPFCKEEAKMLRDNLLTAYPKQVKLYFREFPIESLHPWAKSAAIAGRCVMRQNTSTFWDYHDWIFARQEQVTAENFKDQVTAWVKDRKDLDAMQFGQCLETKATAADVDKSAAMGRDLGINSTPTLFINGRRIAQAIDWPSLRNIIDYEIEYQKTAKDAGDDCGCSIDLNLPGAPKGQGGPLGGVVKH